MIREPKVDIALFVVLIAFLAACWWLGLPTWVLVCVALALVVQVIAWIGNRDIFRRGINRK